MPNTDLASSARALSLPFANLADAIEREGIDPAQTAKLFQALADAVNVATPSK